MVSEYIRISGDGCFLISSSCDKTFLNPSDISFIHCFLELFRTLISNTFSTIQFLYFSFASFFTPFDNWSIYKVFSFGYKISGPATYYLTYQFSFHFWENWCSYWFTGEKVGEETESDSLSVLHNKIITAIVILGLLMWSSYLCTQRLQDIPQQWAFSSKKPNFGSK